MSKKRYCLWHSHSKFFDSRQAFENRISMDSSCPQSGATVNSAARAGVTDVLTSTRSHFDKTTLLCTAAMPGSCPDAPAPDSSRPPMLSVSALSAPLSAVVWVRHQAAKHLSFQKHIHQVFNRILKKAVFKHIQTSSNHKQPLFITCPKCRTSHPGVSAGAPRDA